MDEILTCLFLVGLAIMAALQGGPIFNRPQSNTQFMGTLLGALAFTCALSSAKRPFLTLLREWLPYLLALSCYESMKHLHLSSLSFWLGIHPRDAQLLAIDNWLFGRTPYFFFEDYKLSHGITGTILRYFYMVFYVVPFAVMGYFQSKRDMRDFRLVRRAMLLTLYGGYTSYVFIPAIGPTSANTLVPPESMFNHIVTYDELITTFRYEFDCFPSIHTAVPWMLLFLIGAKLPLKGSILLLVCCLGITLATLAIGYHYAIDDIAGIIWALVACFLAKLSLRTRPFFSFPFQKSPPKEITVR